MVGAKKHGGQVPLAEGQADREDLGADPRPLGLI